MSSTFEYSKAITVEEANWDYNAFSGADMVAFMGHKKIGTLQGITVSITREVVPVYVAGNPNPVTVVKGKRAIAGNIVFSQFDRHAVIKAAEAFRGRQTIGQLWSELPKQPSFTNLDPNYTTGAFGSTDAGNKWLEAVNTQNRAVYELVKNRALRYSDQVPPFDVTITFVNESGASAFAAVLGIQLGNEGYGWTLDDITPEMAVTYVAKGVMPLTPLSDQTMITSSN